MQNIQETLNRETDNATYTQIKFTQTDDSQLLMPEYEGWRSLESSLRSLQSIIQAMGQETLVSDLTKVVQLLQQSSQNINRFVREITFHVIK